MDSEVLRGSSRRIRISKDEALIKEHATNARSSRRCDEPEGS